MKHAPRACNPRPQHIPRRLRGASSQQLNNLAAHAENDFCAIPVRTTHSLHFFPAVYPEEEDASSRSGSEPPSRADSMHASKSSASLADSDQPPPG